MSQTRGRTQLPGSLEADPIARAWAEAHSGAARLCDWWPDEVLARLEHAIRQNCRTAGPVGPKLFGNAWPDAANFGDVTWEELLARVQGGEKFSSRHRLGPSHAEVSAEEAALRWPVRYVAEHDGARLILMIWMRAMAHRKRHWKRYAAQILVPDDDSIPKHELARRRESVGRTITRRRHQAGLLIATGLIRDDVRIDDDTLFRRLADQPAARAEGEE